jgi:hopene-associated glycosyltransferase HpnB
MLLTGIGVVAAAIWSYLVFARGGFWTCSQRDGGDTRQLASTLSVMIVIPARNEAAGIAETVTSLLQQDCPGRTTIILVDDNSDDGTGDVARQAAAAVGGEDRLQVIEGRPLPRGWTGKLWAVKQGVEAAQNAANPPDYILLSDADIVYDPGVLRSLVARAEASGLVLTSLMVKLNCESAAEKGLVPAFIFFFQMLYPFVWVNRPSNATAAAAGGCMLVKSNALKTAGGIDAIRTALIDDCTLAKLLKAHGPIWLGLTDQARSTRPYPDVAEIWHMVARSAYAQLRYSPLLLAGTVVGMGLTYLAPPLLALFASGPAQWLGIATWALMALAFQPTLRFYGRSPLWGIALPAIALCYMLFTLDSALQFARGKGGMWKGRAQAIEP